MAKSNSNVVNQRTALVYTGAALLIGIVGIRTLLSVAEEWGTMEYVTLGAIGIEFAVLLLYAFTIYTDDSEVKKKTPQPIALNNGSAVNGQQPINSLVDTLNKNQISLEKAFQELNELTQAVNGMSNENSRLQARISLVQEKADIRRRYVGRNKSKGELLEAELDRQIERLQ